MRWVYSPAHVLHDPVHEVQFGVPVPAYEVPARAEAIREAMEADDSFERIAPSEHGVEPILRVHEPRMVHFLEEAWAQWAEHHRRRAAGPVDHPDAPVPALIPDSFLHPAIREGMGSSPEPRQNPVARAGMWGFETMTPIGPGTYRAARAAVDVALTAADLVLDGQPAAYGLCRPPGHHAPRAAFGGYCFFNNAAIAAEHLAGATGERVAILDLDYHHGNGTQQIFYRRANVLYVSLHGDPDRAYPYFAGWAEETGAGPGIGATLNIPLPEGCSDRAYLTELRRGLEAIRSYRCPFLVVSLGVDTHREDPICDFALTTPVYEEIGQRVRGLGMRTVVLQEGGYHLPSIGPSVRGFLRGVDGTATPAPPA
jgi:acetoin utilization deacetylase AcuC-like enzyme